MSINKKRKRRSFKRKFNHRLIKSNTSYSIKDISELFNVEQNTVRHWIKSGLKVNDNKVPAIIHCEELRSFLIRKQKTKNGKCNQDEMFCFGCKTPRKIFKNLVALLNQNNKIMHLKGRCQSCGSFMTRKYSIAKLPEIKQFFNLSVNCQVNT